MRPFDQGRRPLVDSSRFAMIPRGDVPRATFNTSHTMKTTFDAALLIPIYCDEVLPGDMHNGSATLFARLSTPVFPIMDQLYLDTFFFFVPNRLVWTNWRKMMGEQTNPGDSISFTTPQIVSPAGGFAVGSVYDYFGLPTAGQITGGNTVSVNALPLRAYALIWNEWFRDENLQNSQSFPTGDSDSNANYTLLRRNKKHDYFSSALPWPLKGTDVQLPGFTTGANANINGIAVKTGITVSAASASYLNTAGGTPVSLSWPGQYMQSSAGAATDWLALRATTTGSSVSPNIYADMSTVAGATINALRLAAATQKLLEKDARGGTRYTELLRSHFGVMPEDARLQRPEYIGGDTTLIQTAAIPQTSATGLTGGSSPIGSLGAAATATGNHTFRYQATEHGFIIGMVNVNAELTYQQGLRRQWTRLTRYDHYWPTFADLGEQVLRNDELYATGTATDTQAFGYQERWAEYKYRPSYITGLFKSTSAGTIDPWHLSIKYTSLPVLSTFINDTPPLSRVLAAGAAANGMQILLDSVWNIRSTRPLPMYSIPGVGTRF